MANMNVPVGDDSEAAVAARKIILALALQNGGEVRVKQASLDSVQDEHPHLSQSWDAETNEYVFKRKHD